MKKKNLLVKVLSLSLALFLLAGCGNNGISTNGEQPESGGESASGGSYTISLSSHQSSSSVHHYTVAEFKSRVEERTGGAVTINLFEDAQLGNERDHPDVPGGYRVCGKPPERLQYFAASLYFQRL